MVRMMLFTLIFTLVSVASPSLYAQAPLVPDTKNENADMFGPRKQMATIIFSGLAGAILGLSTLSFYGRPQDRLSNIAVGFAVGVIIGTAYTTYKAATRPYQRYQLPDGVFQQPTWTESVAQLEWQEDRFAQMQATKPSIPVFQYAWSF